MAKGTPRISATAKPRKTTLIGHSGTPASKATPKPNTLVKGGRGSTGGK
jgi:hypothetical protein